MAEVARLRPSVCGGLEAARHDSFSNYGHSSKRPSSGWKDRRRGSGKSLAIWPRSSPTTPPSRAASPRYKQSTKKRWHKFERQAHKSWRASKRASTDTRAR